MVADIFQRFTARVKLVKVSTVQDEGGGNGARDKQVADLNFSVSISEILSVVEIV